MIMRNNYFTQKLKGNRKGNGLIKLISICICLMLISNGIHGYIFSRKVTRWKEVTGRIQTATARLDTSWNPSGIWSRLSYMLNWQQDSVVVIEYQYTHDGDQYSDSRIWQETHTSLATAEMDARNLSSGDSILVYFNPYRPEESVLYKPSSRNSLITLAAGLIFLVGTVMIFKFQG